MTMLHLAAFGLALSEPTRIRILAALRVSELCVCEICDALELTQSTLSTHLRTLRQSGLVATRKKGKWIYYSLKKDQPGLDPFLKSFFNLAQPAFSPASIVAADARRLKKRLRLREDGCCAIGF